jgi:N-acyl-D-amino-acid deacylase
VIRGARRLAAIVLLVSVGLACAESTRVDTLLRGATVHDGTGGAGRLADIAIDDGKIVALGRLTHVVADRELDLRGRTIVPGFVDIHSHADLILLAGDETRNRLLEARLRQGVTTIVVGNCGLGPAPAGPDAAAILAGVNGWMTPAGVEAGPLTTAAYLDALEARRPPLNVATLVPHGPLRIGAMGLAPGAPDAGRPAAMASVLRESLDAGAYGLSAGLIYPPGMYSGVDELAALAGVVAETDGLVTLHVRGSSETLLPATEELIEIARRSGARTHHSHLEAVGRRFWPRIAEVLAAEDAARGEGLRLSHDVFPYTRAATMMSAIFPPWSLAGGVPALLERLEDPATRERIRADLGGPGIEWHNLVGAVGWDGIYVASVGPDGPAAMVGRDLHSIAADAGKDPFDVVVELMLAERGRVGQLVGEISGDGDELDGLLSILAHPAAAVVSDAEDYGRGVPHPAHAGAFARVLRLNRERRLMDDGELVRRMTGRPAAIVGLEGVGRLAVGEVADLVVLDAETVGDAASWEDPRAFATGIEGVMVGGRWAVREGVYRPGANGRILRRSRAAPPS